MSAGSRTTRARFDEARRARRARTVWGALVASMTVVGGLLLVVPGQGAVRGDGRALPMVGVSRPNTLEAVLTTRTPLDKNRWQAIVIHHSGDPGANPASLEAQARAAGLNGLGYHFVIGNGVRMDDGEVHVSYRWLDQGPGAHVAGRLGEAYNVASIGICLVGDGDRGAFTERQVQRLAQLVRLLSAEFDIPPERVLLHRELAEVSSPGRLFPEAAFREALATAPR